MVIIAEEEYLAHYGILRKSGRYPWGSGNNQSTRNKDFLSYVDGLKAQGLSEKEIAQGINCSIKQLREAKTEAVTQQRQEKIAMAERLRDKGLSYTAIGERMGIGESSVRALLAPGVKARNEVLKTTANMLRDQVNEKKFVQVGAGVPNQIGVSKEKLDTALSMLRNEGYEVHNIPIPQLGTGKNTQVKVLCLPGTTQSEAWKNRFEIKTIQNFSDDGGYTRYGILPPIGIASNRVAIRYADEGGAQSDGVIFVRPGVKDLSLGHARYAQVRIKVGNDHYLKGMAMYKEDLPEGVDLLFNTNKSNTGDKRDAMKPLSDDPDNPFGAVINHQIINDPKLPRDKQKLTSVMNIVNEEGDWSKWSKSIASQVLSKQNPSLAKAQLDMTYEERKNNFASITKLTNPTVRKKLLENFADTTDSASVHLKAAALPKQGWHAILPLDTMPPAQIYAPNYNNGDSIALIRYPHGGTFEIPLLTVNNNNHEAKALFENARDAVGIHHSVAQRLSGADFDGDTVLVIPNNLGKINSTPALEGLRNFDPKASYPKYDGMHVMTDNRKQLEMGKISNLITDMSLRNASTGEIAQAVRHSMVVIDSVNHELNWKQSYIDNAIPQLKQKYQGGPTAGAATLISRAGADVWIPEKIPRPHKEGGPVNPQTGKLEFKPTGRKITTRDGKVVPKRQRSIALKEEDDAIVLSSGTPMERLYVTHSNRLKAMANTARLAALNTPSQKYSPSAKKVYASEVARLDAELSLAQQNAPLERQAQIIANATVRLKKDDNPNMDKITEKKIGFQALEEARARLGAQKHQIKFTDSEWEAIQAGAVSDYKLSQMLRYADMDRVYELATPKDVKLMTTAKTKRAKDMLDLGYTRAQVANQLGVSVSTLDTAIYPSTE